MCFICTYVGEVGRFVPGGVIFLPGLGEGGGDFTHLSR